MDYFKIYTMLLLYLFVTYGEISDSSFWKNLPEECGKTRFDQNKVRIIDGDQAALGQFPWIVRLGRQLREEVFFYCGGSLITRFYALSAAHCGKIIEMVRVGYNCEGNNDCDEFGDCALPYQDIKIKEKIFANFTVDTQLNDIMLIELQKPAEFNDYVQPVCLPRKRLLHEYFINKFVTVAGWGVENVTYYLTSKCLMYINIPIVDPQECNSLYRYELEKSQFCIGHKGGGQDSCAGDSGGPATRSMRLDGERRQYLIGIVSYGLTRCGNGVGVYTDVSYFLNWILENIKRV